MGLWICLFCKNVINVFQPSKDASSWRNFKDWKRRKNSKDLTIIINCQPTTASSGKPSHSLTKVDTFDASAEIFSSMKCLCDSTYKKLKLCTVRICLEIVILNMIMLNKILATGTLYHLPQCNSLATCNQQLLFDAIDAILCNQWLAIQC